MVFAIKTSGITWEKQREASVMIIYANTSDSIECKRKPIARCEMFTINNKDTLATSLKLLCWLYC